MARVPKRQAERTAARKALEFVQRVKRDVDRRKAAAYAKALAAKKYQEAEALGRLVLAGKAQKVLNRVSAAVREGRLDANALDRVRLRETMGEALTDYQANGLMRNGLSTAYNAGYYEQGMADNTKQFWLYETRLDDRVRPGHAKWEGLILAKNDPLVALIFPPGGHNCRCRMRAISRADATARIAAGTATIQKPAIKKQTYIDKRTGEKIKTIEGVDPGWMGLPSDSAETLGKLLELQMARLEATPLS